MVTSDCPVSCHRVLLRVEWSKRERCLPPRTWRIKYWSPVWSVSLPPPKLSRGRGRAYSPLDSTGEVGGALQAISSMMVNRGNLKKTKQSWYSLFCWRAPRPSVIYTDETSLVGGVCIQLPMPVYLEGKSKSCLKMLYCFRTGNSKANFTPSHFLSSECNVFEAVGTLKSKKLGLSKCAHFLQWLFIPRLAFTPCRTGQGFSTLRHLFPLFTQQNQHSQLANTSQKLMTNQRLRHPRGAKQRHLMIQLEPNASPTVPQPHSQLQYCVPIHRFIHTCTHRKTTLESAGLSTFFIGFMKCCNRANKCRFTQAALKSQQMRQTLPLP